MRQPAPARRAGHQEAVMPARISQPPIHFNDPDPELRVTRMRFIDDEEAAMAADAHVLRAAVRKRRSPEPRRRRRA